VRLTRRDKAVSPPVAYDFVRLDPTIHEFYVRTPQCHSLYSLQRYTFRVSAPDQRHKLAIKTPSGKLHRMMSVPDKGSYECEIVVVEGGTWKLIYFSEVGGERWSTIANWACFD